MLITYHNVSLYPTLSVNTTYIIKYHCLPHCGCYILYYATVHVFSMATYARAFSVTHSRRVMYVTDNDVTDNGIYTMAYNGIYMSDNGIRMPYTDMCTTERCVYTSAVWHFHSGRSRQRLVWHSLLCVILFIHCLCSPFEPQSRGITEHYLTIRICIYITC